MERCQNPVPGVAWPFIRDSHYKVPGADSGPFVSICFRIRLPGPQWSWFTLGFHSSAPEYTCTTHFNPPGGGVLVGWHARTLTSSTTRHYWSPSPIKSDTMHCIASLPLLSIPLSAFSQCYGSYFSIILIFTLETLPGPRVTFPYEQLLL